MTFSQEGAGHIFTGDGIAYLVGGLHVDLGNGDTSPAALVLQRVHAEDGGCVEDHIRQFWILGERRVLHGP